MQNPNIVGSGYIAFPPQKPFEKPLIVQPPTVAVWMVHHRDLAYMLDSAFMCWIVGVHMDVHVGFLACCC